MRTSKLATLSPVLAALAALAAPALAGCGDDDADADAPDASTAPLYEGGRITVPGCGYDVITRLGAEAPAAGEAVLGADPTPFQIHLGLGGAPATTIAVSWRTDEATTATVVRWGVAGSLDQETAGLTFRFIAGLGGVGDVVRIHETHLCGLTPDTAYDYQVGGVGADGVERFSPTASFRTAPDRLVSPDAEVSVVYVGDSRGGYDVWGALASQIVARAPDLIVFTGDIVTIGQNQLEWDEFFTAGAALFTTAPMVLAHGNHEVNAVNYYSMFAMPGDEENFAFDYGPLHQVVANDSPPELGSLAGSTRDFLDADLAAAADAPWLIVSHHRSLWSSSTRHGSDETLRALWGVLYDQYLVDVVISGHDHIFERTKPLRGETIGATPADGTVYVVSGGAGADLYSVEPQPYTELAESTHSFTLLTMRPGLLSSESFRDDGSPLDSFTITKPVP